MSRETKVFIVEGESREPRFVREMIQSFFQGKYQTKVVTLAAAQNIYMLYQKLKEDDFETDIIEVLREQNEEIKNQLEGIAVQDISEIYMFFDWDFQEDNLRGAHDKLTTLEILEEMLEFYDNETENGKLYLSYPMVEAVYDYQDGLCEAFSSCFVSLDQIKRYKNTSSAGNPKASRHLQFDEWKMIMNVFVLRLKCLLETDDMEYDYYNKKVDPLIILRAQEELNTHGEVFVLSAFPEFLLDYFRPDFWNSMIKLKKEKYRNCAKLS